MQARLMDPTQKFMLKGQIPKKPSEEENPDDVFSSFTWAQKVKAQRSKPKRANEEENPHDVFSSFIFQFCSFERISLRMAGFLVNSVI